MKHTMIRKAFWWLLIATATCPWGDFGCTEVMGAQPNHVEKAGEKWFGFAGNAENINLAVIVPMGRGKINENRNKI